MEDKIFERITPKYKTLVEFWKFYREEGNDFVKTMIPPLKTISLITIEFPGISHERSSDSGGLFLHFLKGEFSLLKDIAVRYQIYDKTNFKISENCLIHCLKLSGILSDAEIESIKERIMNQEVSKKNLKLIASEYKFIVVLTKIKNNNKRVNEKFGSGEREIKINMWKDKKFNQKNF